MALGSTSIAALTREGLRNSMLTTLFGRRAGMDVNGYEVGEEDTRLPIDNITTTVGTSLSPNGFSNFSCTVASSAIHTLLRAIPGIYKQITQLSSSTLGIVLQFGPNAQIVTTAGTSFNQITFSGVGHTINLACMASGSSIGSSANGGGVWIATGVFTSTASGLSLSTY